jgi:PKD repeat protein
MRSRLSFLRPRRPSRMRGSALRRVVILAAGGLLLAGLPSSVASGAPPTGFQETTVFTALTNPTSVEFASDGRVFVAEKSGRIKVFDNLSDPTPTIFADLNANVYNFWDRGLLGMALHPNFPATPNVYVLYTHDAEIGGAAPKYGTPGILSDPCPNPPGATGDGCVVSGRLSKLTANGNVMTGSEDVLIEDWCQQYPSHSIGALDFGADGALYVSGGDGASFNFADHGQDGNPLNPCGDPPGGVGQALSPPTAEGGALRSQDLRTSGDPVTLDGTVLRLDPETGAGMPDNPLAFNPDPNARRIVAHGLRNPFRLTVRPGTSDVWVGDVGWTTWEEINRLGPTNDSVVDNFGWPCREGTGRHPGYDGQDLAVCENLYAAGLGAVRGPVYTYQHSDKVSTETCPVGSSSTAGVAFYDGGNYPSNYFGALFFADYSRDCIWVMFPGTDGLPNPASRAPFVEAAAGPVDLEIGPNGDLFYVDFDGGTIRRIRHLGSNQPPVANAQASPTSGPTPLTVNFDGTGSTDPEGSGLAYAWDLDGDGQFDDSTAAQPTFTYSSAGTYLVRLRATDPGGATDTDDVTVTAGASSPPVATIVTPTVGTTWKVGDSINFSGSATDAEDGPLSASSLTWSVIMHHCPSNCHTHPVQNFVGVSSGSFVGPDHEYPSHIELRLTATDSAGLHGTTSIQLDPQTVALSFTSQPSGLQLTVGPFTGTTPFNRTVIAGSTNSLAAPTPQSLSTSVYEFTSWSDGGAQTHNVVAPQEPTTYQATYTLAGEAGALAAAYAFDEGNGTTVTDRSGNSQAGTLSGGATWSTEGRHGGALSLDGLNDMVTVADSGLLDLTTGMTIEGWVRPTTSDTRFRTFLIKEGATAPVYRLYANTPTPAPRAQADIAGGLRRATGATPLPVGVWSHLAATFDGTTLRLWVNGNEVASFVRAGTIATSTGPLRIGGTVFFDEFFAGLVDDVRVYNVALTQAQIQADMNTPVAPPPPPDTEPPSAPAGLTATGGLGSASLSWTASTDNVGVDHYDVHRSTVSGFTVGAANRIGQATGTSFQDGPPAGTHFYRVVAVDAAGNPSAPSNQSSATVTADTTPPTVSVTEPADESSVSGTVNVSANASDNVSVAGVQFRLDGLPLGDEDTSAPFTLSWDTNTAANGDHDLTAVARDPAGNTTVSAVVDLTVSNTPPPPVGLVAAYAFDEGSGSTVVDRSGNGQTGTVSGGAAWSTEGRHGGALSLDGVNDLVTVADSNLLDLTTAMTIEGWVKPTTSGTSFRTFVIKENGTSHVYRIYANTSVPAPRVQAAIADGIRTATGTTPLAANAWSHLAATYDGTVLRLWVNGTQVATTLKAPSIATSTGAFRIGGRSVSPNEFFAGLVDDVRVYNTALTQAQIQADMNTPVAPPPPPDTEPPTAPTNLAAVGGLGTVSLTWTGSTDDRGVDHYDVHRSPVAGFVPGPANRVGQPTGTSFADSGMAAGTYFYKVVAVDAAGNDSAQSNEASAAVTADTTSPTVAISAPADESTVFETVTITANASDNVGVAGVQFKANGVNVGAEDATAPYSVAWDTRGGPNGDYDLTAVARDAAGNTTTSAIVDVTVSNGPTPPPPGLVASYAFEEGTGTTLTDRSRNGHNGTISGAAWSAAGKYGNALLFDGVDDLVSVADSNLLDLTTGMTIEGWLRPTTSGTSFRTFVIKEDGSSHVYRIYANTSALAPRAQAAIAGGVRSATGTTALPVNVWSHVAATYDGTTLRLWVNGNEVANVVKAPSIATSTGAFRIGGRSVSPGEFFAGLVDDVRVYNVALTQAQIQADMNTPVAPDTSPPVVSSVAPAAGATGVLPSAAVQATFNEEMNPATVSGTTFTLSQGASPVAATVTYDSASRTATLTPNAHLAFSTTYTARLRGGSTDPRLKDAAGNALAADHTWSFATAAQPPAAPILVLTSPGNGFGSYLPEILRAEGLNSFTVADASLLSSSLLANYDLVLLGETNLTAGQVTTLTNWVTGGGDVIAMRPDKQLVGLLGLTDAGSTLSNAYLQVSPSGPGAGIVTQTMQYHGTADRYALNGATSVATLFATASSPTPNPAVTLRAVGGTGGQAAAFTYDLARSIVYTRQGNPAWIGQNRDGISPIRTNDLFYGAFPGDVQPNWIDLSNMGIPQADEQQRLLVNLIETMIQEDGPLPRFWYLPRGEKAAVIMTGDDHGLGGTPSRFDAYKAASPPGCSVVEWECVRSTAYVYSSVPMSDAQAAGYLADGFEIALHLKMGTGGGCANATPAAIQQALDTQLPAFASTWPSLPAPETNRTHCTSWSGWVDEPELELTRGMRLDFNSYHYPGSWLGSVNGYLTGSNMLMRFARLDGTPFDVFHAHTHLTDESDQSYPAAVNFLLDNAVGAPGYYGFIGVNAHTDLANSAESDAILASAQARGVPIISAKQALTWTDGRNGSSFTGVSWTGNVLGFGINQGAGANGLQAMLPTQSSAGTLTTLTRGGSPVSFTTQTIKGVQYAFFTATNGQYSATYGP